MALTAEQRLAMIAKAAEAGVTDLDQLSRAVKREQATRSLHEFIRQGWDYIDPAAFVDGWHIQAICEHLQAAVNGEIRHLLINMPPRHMKSIAVSVALAPWVWIQRNRYASASSSNHSASGTFRPQNNNQAGLISPSSQVDPRTPPMRRDPLRGPHVSFLYTSYAQNLSLRDSIKARRLIESPWYRENWPTVELCSDANTVTKFENTAKGYRMATSVDGRLTGEGGNIIVVDDPHNTVEMDSEKTIEGVLDWWDQAMPTRLNNPETDIFVMVMQRLRQNDLSGHILSKQDESWTHLMLPCEYEPKRHCFISATGWHDPRGLDDEGELLEGLKTGLLEEPEVEVGSAIAGRRGLLLWPERFSAATIGSLKKTLGPFGSAGQLQQWPVPEGGGIIREEWWRKFPQPEDEALYLKLRRTWDEQAGGYIEREVLDFPSMEYVIACADTAYTEDEENDYSACVVMGIWRDKTDNAKVMVMRYWQERLELHKLVGRLATTCCLGGKGKNAVYVDKLLIENKASGKSVAQEIRRLFGTEKWVTETHDVKGDKVARAYSIQAMFADKMVYAPDRAWAQELIKSTALFPKGPHDDAQDALFSGLRYLRDGGYLQMRRERVLESLDRQMLRPPERPLYDV